MHHIVQSYTILRLILYTILYTTRKSRHTAQGSMSVYRGTRSKAHASGYVRIKAQKTRHARMQAFAFTYATQRVYIHAVQQIHNMHRC